MWYLFLDESGDLGFDFVNKKPSRFFTICVLATSSRDSYIGIRNSIKRTRRRKINKRGKARNLKNEIKGTQTSLPAKSYFYKKVSGLRFGIYAVTLNKKGVYNELASDKARVYNYISRLVLDEIPFEQADDRIQLYIDRSKGSFEIRELMITSSGNWKVGFGRESHSISITWEAMKKLLFRLWTYSPTESSASTSSEMTDGSRCSKKKLYLRSNSCDAKKKSVPPGLVAPRLVP